MCRVSRCTIDRCLSPPETGVFPGGAGCVVGRAHAVQSSSMAVGTWAPSLWWEPKQRPCLTLGGASITLPGPPVQEGT